jgi:hypothetical protein
MDFYLFEIRRSPSILYTEGERVDPQTRQELKPDYASAVDRFLERLGQREGRFSRFLRNLILVVRNSYYKLEEKIDPMERVFKAMRHARELNLYHSPQLDQAQAAGRLDALLTRQQKKHLFWTAVDLVLTCVAVLLTPVLVPIPGPNFFFYYPAARLVSHILARRGTLHGIQLKSKAYMGVPEIQEIELELNRRRDCVDFDKIGQAGLRLRLERLLFFLKRYV